MIWRALNKDERGFTLLETLLAVSILAMLLAIVLSAFRLGIRSWEKGEAAIDSSAARRAIVSRLSADAGSMYPYSQNSGQAAEAARPLFSAGNESLGFVTVTGGASPWGGAKWVYYSVDSAGLTVREKTVPAVDLNKNAGGALIELEGGVNGIRFEYLGPSGWEESWDIDLRKTLPGAIKATLSFRDGSTFSALLPVGVGRQ